MEGREGWGFRGSGGAFRGGILGRRRGGNGRFYREIPRFLSGARVRRGDSAHGGQRRAVGAKKFLKTFKKKDENPEIGGARGAGRWRGATLYRAHLI